MGKAHEAFQRSAQIEDTTIGWRFHQSADEAAVRRRRHAGDGGRTSPRIIRSRGKTRTRSRSRSQQRAAKAQGAGFFAEEIEPVVVPGGKAGPITVSNDEHLRPDTTAEGLAKLKPFVRQPGTITAATPRASMTAPPQC